MEIIGLLHEQRRRRLQIGAAGQLLMSGELTDVVPLDDEETHQAANPIRGEKVVLSLREIAAREEAIVARLIAGDEPVSVIVLGAGHDLGRLLERHGVEYNRVMRSKLSNCSNDGVSGTMAMANLLTNEAS